MFKHRKLECPVKIKLSRKRFYPSKLMKYFGDKIDENLNWKDQTHDISTKLNKGNALLNKIRNYVSSNTLKVIYFTIFNLDINCANLIANLNFKLGTLPGYLCSCDL